MLELYLQKDADNPQQVIWKDLHGVQVLPLGGKLLEEVQ